MLSTNNPSYGFFGTVQLKRGEKGAQQAWQVAFTAIQKAVPKANPADIRNFLDSKYGRHTADQVLDGTSVQDQIEARRARFIKKFAEIQRQAEAFED